MILDLTIELGATSKQEANVGKGIGALLALPLYIHGLASALVIAMQYVKDAWNGHTLVKRFVFGRMSVVVAEWIGFVIFLGIPLLAMVVTLFAGMDNADSMAKIYQDTIAVIGGIEAEIS